MDPRIALIESRYLRKETPDFRAGDTVKVHVKVTEGSRQRIQIFEGVVIARKHGGTRETFTVRKISSRSTARAWTTSRWYVTARSAGPSSTT